MSLIANRDLLRNAWRRVLTSRNIAYRQFQRREIEAFGTCHEALLDEIYAQLSDQTYSPTKPDRVDVPKGELSTRTAALLTLPDWIVYTALGTLVSEAVMPSEQWRYNKSVFSNRPRRARRRPGGFFHLWETQYNRFNKACEAASGKHPFLLECDLTAFYDLIDHQLLLSKIRRYMKDVYSLELLEVMLRGWTGTTIGHGLPQGLEVSGFLADMFLFQVDDELQGGSSYSYLRYVDDIRVFSGSRRECEALAVRLESSVKTLGLVPNSSKTQILDTRRTTGWLRQLDYGAFREERRKRGLKRTSVAAKLEHLGAKNDFMRHIGRRPGSPRDELLIRKSLSRMLPDGTVIRRLLSVYPYRPDLWELAFLYLLDCVADQYVQRFCWRRLRLPPAMDWESARLIDTAMQTRLDKRLSRTQVETLSEYLGKAKFPLAQAQAAAALITSGQRRPAAHWLRPVSESAMAVAVWLLPILRRRSRPRGRKKSTIAIVRRLITSSSQKTALLTAYLAGLKLGKADMSKLPAPRSTYSRIVLSNVCQVRHSQFTDEIAPLLREMLRLKIPPGFDFRSTLGTMDAKLYAQALKHLRRAEWYVDTSPSYFVNHIHNFNHVLLHFALRKHNLVSTTLKWRDYMGQLQSLAIKNMFPTMAVAFDACRVARNTNLASHPMDDRRNRFTKSVTYRERDRIKSQLKAAYAEFMRKV